jgi:DNA polymerase (family 10)
MMELEKAKDIAREVIKELEPYCQRIQVAGSIRRQKPFPRDIDIVLIPRDRAALDQSLMVMGHYKMSGNKITRVEMDSIPLDIYFATPETFATLLLIRTGSTENNIRLCSVAKKKGWHLFANGDGLFNQAGQRVAGDSEESIYKALGLPWQRPEERG